MPHALDPSAPACREILRVRNVQVCLRSTGRELLCLEELDIARGEIVGLAGPTGAGKTLTGLAVMGMLPPDAKLSSGEILFEGRNLCALSERQYSDLRGTRLSLVFQSPNEALDPLRTCRVQLEEPLLRHGEGSERNREQILIDSLRRVGFVDTERILRSRPTELSGGERQRILLAMSDLHSPRLMIADEPTSGLDPPLALDFARALRDRAEREGRAALIISHDHQFLGRSTDRIVWLADGRLAAPQHAEPFPSQGRARRSRQSPLLEVREIRKSFASKSGRLAAVDDISFSVGLGEVVGVIGASGAGKSTLARMIVGLTSTESGMIAFAEASGTEGAPAQLIFQDPRTSLNPSMRLGDAVEEPMLFRKPAAEARSEAKALFAKVGLDIVLYHRLPREASGGQCQLAAIARALAAEPVLLIADEPTASLDARPAEKVIGALRKLADETGVGVIIMSHDIALISAVCDRVLVLERGKLVEQGAVDQVLRYPRHAETERLLGPFRQTLRSSPAGPGTPGATS